jgi:glycolate oxidase FAD binding subunit
MNAAAVSESTREVADRVRAARAARRPLRITGAARWLDAGRPCRAGETLEIGAQTGVVEYEPGDLTLTARAGTSLAELARVTRAEGQWLPLDPFGAADGTIGATMATASAGPLSSAFGTPRDQAIGCELVTGAGEIVRAGGRVVKNVAGFDLVRLAVGAWGTLGVITEVSLRLRALPERERTLAIDVGAEDAWRWLRASEFTPLAAELLSPPLARALGASAASSTLLLRLGGNDAYVAAAAESASALGTPREVDGRIWDALAAIEPPGSAVIRLSTAPSRVAPLWERAASIVERAGGIAHATLRRGVVRCILPVSGGGEDELARLRGMVGALQHLASSIVERLPASLWASLVPPTAMDRLSIGARDAFDPDRLLNPGILGEWA